MAARLLWTSSASRCTRRGRRSRSGWPKRGSDMSEAINPYAAPTARVDDAGANPEAEAIRRAHLSHEASIRAIGILYYLGGGALTIAGIASLFGAEKEPAALAVAVLLIAVGAGQLVAGWGVRAFRSWGRVVGCVVAVIGLLGFPIGTLINAYILYLFL